VIFPLFPSKSSRIPANLIVFTRYQQENMILLGTWFGSSKPDFHLLMDPISTQLNHCQFQGDTPEGEREISFKLLALTADNQAKEMVLNLKSTHCPNCQQVPVYEKNRNGVETVACFKYEAVTVERTNVNIGEDMDEAYDEGRVVRRRKKKKRKKRKEKKKQKVSFFL